MYFQAVAVLCISLFRGSSGKLGGEVTREWGDRQVRKQCYVKRKEYPDDLTGNPLFGGKSFAIITLEECKAACSVGAKDSHGRPCIGIEWSDRTQTLPADAKRNCALVWGCEILAGNPSGSVWLLSKTLSPVPAPKTPAPVPAPKTLSPVPAPKTLSPIPAPKTLSPVPAPKTLSPVPAPKPASPWVIGGAGASCAESCAEIGKKCESVKTTTISQLKNRLQQAGELNPKISNRSWKTGSGLNPAFLPGTNNWWVLGKVAPDCNASAFDRSGLCYCKGKALDSKLVPPPASSPGAPRQRANDWWACFNRRNWCKVQGYMTGLYRSDKGSVSAPYPGGKIDGLYLIEEASSADAPPALQKGGRSCVNTNWSQGAGSFEQQGWAVCGNGSYINTIFRDGNTGQDSRKFANAQGINNIKQSLCCRPKRQRGGWGACYDLDVSRSLDVKGWSICASGYYVAGLHRTACNDLSCLDKFKCCKMGASADGEVETM